MAVVINGNGTVTGISVGGLPDGIVDSGTLATNSVDSAELIDGSIDNSHLADDAVAVAELSATGTASSSTFLRGDNSWAEAGGGKVLQVVQTHLTSVSSQSLSSATATNITGLNVTITPSSTSSKILITVRWAGEQSSNNYNCIFGIKRNTTAVGNGTANSSSPVGITIISQGYFSSHYSSTPDSAMYEYLDSPSTTSAVTYYATIESLSAQTLYNQRTAVDGGTTDQERLTSTITVMEIGA